MSENFTIGNRQYKDRLFIFLFGKEERRQWTLELYNAINGTDYKDPSAIEINTLENVLYLGMRNDVSFILDGGLSIFEHQSSTNPNMPLRMLEYLVGLYGRYCTEKGYNAFMYNGIPLPSPRFVVFSNWEGERQDERVMRLSDLFMRADMEPDMDLKVRVINVNAGHNQEMMGRCRPLLDYSTFVEEVRRNRGRGLPLGDAIDRAMEEMPGDSPIRGLLVRNRTEVKGMLATEYDEKKVTEMFYRNGKAEGIAEGKAEGLAEGKVEGQKVILELNSILLKEKRYDDLEKASVNDEYLNQLLKQYGLI